MQRRLPVGARALIRHGQHPLRHRVADEDVLLDADLERHLPADLVDPLVPEAPEDALVPLGRAWMQAKQARKELAAAAGTPDAWHMVGGLRRTDPVSPDVALLAVTGEPAAWADARLTACRVTCWWSPARHAVAIAAEPEPIVVHAITPEAAPTSLAGTPALAGTCAH